MNCPEDKPCRWVKHGTDYICEQCGRTKPRTETHRQIRSLSVAAIEWGGIDYPKDK